MFDSIEELLEATEAQVSFGNRILFFDDGEWVVKEKLRNMDGGRYYRAINRFSNQEENAIKNAIDCLCGCL